MQKQSFPKKTFSDTKSQLSQKALCRVSWKMTFFTMEMYSSKPTGSNFLSIVNIFLLLPAWCVYNINQCPFENCIIQMADKWGLHLGMPPWGGPFFLEGPSWSKMMLSWSKNIWICSNFAKDLHIFLKDKSVKLTENWSNLPKNSQMDKKINQIDQLNDQFCQILPIMADLTINYSWSNILLDQLNWSNFA